ncbi:MAG: PilZ domain-containing protein [Desulfocapsa sp.]|nr:PilZ domain-containing protein [Desulfocapsa sp.]
MPSKSKRNALRLCCNSHVVTYKTAYDEGEACLINISSTGCLFECASLPLSVQEKILIRIKLEDEQSAIEAKAVVVRMDDKQIATEFIIVEPETQNLIRSYFTQKLRNS